MPLLQLMDVHGVNKAAFSGRHTIGRYVLLMAGKHQHGYTLPAA
jgi:hypothetical protein